MLRCSWRELKGLRGLTVVELSCSWSIGSENFVNNSLSLLAESNLSSVKPDALGWTLRRLEIFRNA